MTGNRGKGPVEVRARFGEGVRLRRLELGLTQEALAERAGLSQTYVAEIESGKRNVSLVNIERLSGSLELSISELFSGYVAEH